MPEFISDPALDGDRDMDPEDGSAWMDPAGGSVSRYFILCTSKYEVEAESYEDALRRFNNEEATFIEEDAPQVKHEDD